MRLRDSTLVEKPENLPAIEQWIEYVFVDKESREKLRIPHSESPAQAVNARRQPQSKAGGEASPMGNFSTGLRPSLIPTRNSNRGSGEYTERGNTSCWILELIQTRRHISGPATDDVSIQQECFEAVRFRRKGKWRCCGWRGARCTTKSILWRQGQSQESEREGWPRQQGELD